MLQRVPAGRVTTYKDLAHALGTGAYRAVGQVLAKNPFAPTVPCHRVVASDGTIGGFMGVTAGAPVLKKKKLLEKEGVRFSGDVIIEFAERRFTFSR
jgi:methylated-DNA-[protein]-cysteine S-methyltransferase